MEPVIATMKTLFYSSACILLASRAHASALSPLHIEERATPARAACPTGDVLVNGEFYGSVLLLSPSPTSKAIYKSPDTHSIH